VGVSNGVNYCPYCGERVDASVRYCPKCGTRIPVIETSRAEVANEPPPSQQTSYQQPPQQAPYYQVPYTETRYRREDKSTAAFVLSLIGGILILINGLIVAVIGSFFVFFGVGILMIILGLVFGFAVLLSAIMLNANPREHVTWGILILIFSVLSIVIGGGFVVGLILGLIGGILALVQGK